jgi:serine/threonine protein phosphatase PrpC
LLVGAGYLLFQIAGGFPPRAWRFLFDVLPRLQSLWAAQGFGILLPLIGLLLLSLSLLILWSLIVLGISQSLVLLWSTFRQQERWQTDHDESELILEKQTQQSSQSQLRLESLDAMYPTLTQPDIDDEAMQQSQQLFEHPQSRLMLQPQQFQGPSSQQIQPLRGEVSVYAPVPQNRRPHVRRTGTQRAHLQLIPEQKEPEQHFTKDPRGEELLAEEQDSEELELDTRPPDVSEERRISPHTVWDDDDDEEQEAPLHLTIGIGLDPGLVRKNRPNEDNLFAIQGIRKTKDGPVPAGLFVIADGMGGHANGADASRLAVREVSNSIVPTLLREESDDSRDGAEEQKLFVNLLKNGVRRANLAIHQRNYTMPDMMGTTITAALVVDSTAYIINVGDSRTYLYQATEGLVQITRDHSTVARLVEDGEIEPDEIYTHPQRNQIYRCLGEDPTVEMDTFVVPLEPDDILLLCSDGLWEMVRDPIMEKIIDASSNSPAQISNLLVQAALDQGGADNISVIVVGVT